MFGVVFHFDFAVGSINKGLALAILQDVHGISRFQPLEVSSIIIVLHHSSIYNVLLISIFVPTYIVLYLDRHI